MIYLISWWIKVEEYLLLDNLKKTCLYNTHLDFGARMAPFAGYMMPIHYLGGILHEHLHCRTFAALFDVSHMGQITVKGLDAALHLERLMPTDLVGLQIGNGRYTFLTNQSGGVIDDLIVMRVEDDTFSLVVNASNKMQDLRHLAENLPSLSIELDDRALLALQGPSASNVLETHTCHLNSLSYMQFRRIRIGSVDCSLSRTGYTGEDGFEISLPPARASEVAHILVKDERVAWAGLGARDTLRLESGLCLHGQDLSTDITPIEAGLGWSISPSRRRGGRAEGGYMGWQKIMEQQNDGVDSVRVGLTVQGRVPVRSGASLVNGDGEIVGKVTSGSFSPILNMPISMAYVDIDYALKGTTLFAKDRRGHRTLQVVPMPWVKKRYKLT